MPNTVYTITDGRDEWTESDAQTAEAYARSDLFEVKAVTQG